MTTQLQDATVEEALHETLRARFGHTELRPGQVEALRPVLSGEDTLVVMPTGAGKSLVYQLAACLRGGLALVVSPLIALMKDQVDALAARGIPAAAVNSAMPVQDQRAALAAARAGRLRLLYVAPERLQNPGFIDAVTAANVTLLAVDEAHCVSQWGHDFRPDYLRIGPARQRLSNPQVVALTATATRRVQDDIVQTLGMRDAARVVTGFNRPGLTFEVRHTPNERSKYGALAEELGADAGPTLIYVSTRQQAEDVAEFVSQQVRRPAGVYHAGLPDYDRTAVQEAFIGRTLDLVVATNAFGMGVDRADVRLVLHWAVPSDLESYYQEAGRAGRDGQPARAVLYYAAQDSQLRRWFIEQAAPDPDLLERLYDRVSRQARDGQAAVSADQLGEALGEHPVRVRVSLATLGDAGALVRLEDRGGMMRYDVRKLDERRLADRVRLAEARQAHKERALEAMVRYAEQDGCRRRTILDHFGDEGPATAERCCDACLEAATVSEAPQHLPAFDELPEGSRVALGLLDCVRRLPFAVGRRRLTQIMVGSGAEGMDRPAYTSSPYYGRLKHLRQRDVDTLYSELITSGYLKVVGGDRPVVQLTPAGKRALAHREALPFETPVRTRQSSRNRSRDHALPAEDAVLFEVLRSWRARQAGREGVPPYVVFSDATLGAIARERPADEQALLAIKGVGAVKLQKYGEQVLRIVN